MLAEPDQQQASHIFSLVSATKLPYTLNAAPDSRARIANRVKGTYVKVRKPKPHSM